MLVEVSDSMQEGVSLVTYIPVAMVSGCGG
jgi:hypothetical protein